MLIMKTNLSSQYSTKYQRKPPVSKSKPNEIIKETFVLNL